MPYGEMQTQFAGQYTMLIAHPTLINTRMSVTLQASSNAEADEDQMVQEFVNIMHGQGWTVYQTKKVIPAYEQIDPDPA